jgi:hypothetical protein
MIVRILLVSNLLVLGCCSFDIDKKMNHFFLLCRCQGENSFAKYLNKIYCRRSEREYFV